MIGPGTGFAPFRGFLQDRNSLKRDGKEIGPMVLYFGCRRSDEDHIYADEMRDWQEQGVLSQVRAALLAPVARIHGGTMQLHVAYSRETEKKSYVQHKLWEQRESTWQMLEDGAHIYVCG